MTMPREKITDKLVLLVISGGLIIILLTIIIGLFSTPRALPNWAENVFVSIATASALKLGDCLATLVALSQGKHISQMGTQLAENVPKELAKLEKSAPVPADAAEAARQTADAADAVASGIEEEVKP